MHQDIHPPPRYKLAAQLDPHNEGVLIVQLGGGGESGMGVDEIEKRLEKDWRGLYHHVKGSSRRYDSR